MSRPLIFTILTAGLAVLIAALDEPPIARSECAGASQPDFRLKLGEKVFWPGEH